MNFNAPVVKAVYNKFLVKVEYVYDVHVVKCEQSEELSFRV